MPCAILDPLRSLTIESRTHGTSGAARGTEHIGFTVPDLDEAHRFFVDVIGCQYVYSLGPFRADDDWMREHLGVDPRSVMRELRFYRLRVRPELRDLPVGCRRRPASAAPQQRHRRSSPRVLRRRPRRAVAYLREQGIECSASRPQPQRERGPALGVLPDALGHAARARQLPRRQGVRARGRSAAVASREARRMSRRPPARARRGHRPHRRSAARGDHPRRLRARGPHPAGADRRRSPARAARPCARRCGCSRPRAWSRSSPTAAPGSRR